MGLTEVNDSIIDEKGFWLEITGKELIGKELTDEDSLIRQEVEALVNKLKSKNVLPQTINDNDIYHIYFDNNDDPQLTVAIYNSRDKSVINYVRGTKEDGFPLDEYSDELISLLKEKSNSENSNHYLRIIEWNKRIHDYREQIENGTMEKNSVPQMLKDIFGFYVQGLGLNDDDYKIDESLNKDALIQTINTSPFVKSVIANYYGCPEEDAMNLFKVEGKIIEFNLMLDKVQEGKYKFTDEDTKELVQVIIEANSNNITKKLLSKNYDNNIEDPVEGTSHYYTGNLYTRLPRVKPMLAKFFDCNPDEIGIAIDNEKIGKIVDLKTISILEGRHIGEEIPYKVFIGDAEVSGEKIPNVFDSSIKNLDYMIGDLNISGYKGKISDNLAITGNLIADEETELEDLNGLFVGGTAYGLEHLVKEKKDLEGIKHIGKISESSAEYLKEWLKETEDRSDANSANNSDNNTSLEFNSDDIMAATSGFLSAKKYRTTSRIFDEIIGRSNSQRHED